MNPSEDPNDRLIDSLLKEQAKGKPDEALLRAIESKMQSPPKAKSTRRNLDFFWPATAAAVVLLAAGGLFWNAFEKPDEETGRLVEAPGLDAEQAPDPATAVRRSASAPPEPSDVAAAGNEGQPDQQKSEVVAAEMEVEPGKGSGKINIGLDPLDADFVLSDDERAELASEAAGRLLNELRLIRVESTMWYVQFGMESGGNWAPKLQALPAGGKLQTNKISAIEMIKPGDAFFKDGMMAGRFKFLGIVDKVIVSERTKMAQKVKIAQFEDLKPNKKGERYESQYGLPDARLTASAYFDRTAVLEFEGKEFKVEERTGFTLPQGGDFFLKQVTPDRAVVQLRGVDGKVVVREIAR